MIKIIKFAKKSWYIMILIILLLFIQANCELALPQYTSNIVDVGIQYKGIESPIPDTMRIETFKHLQLFLSDHGKELLDTYYKISDEDGYYHFQYDTIPSDQEEAKMQEIKDEFLPAETILMMFTSDGEQYVEIQNQMITAMGMDPDKVDDIFAIFEQMPQEALEQIKTKMNEKMGDMADLIGESMAITFIQEEYTAVGIDLHQIQMDYLKNTGFRMLALAFLAMIASIIVAFFSARLAASTSRELRYHVFEKVIGFSNAEMNQFSTASLITRSTNDIQQVQMALTMIFRIVAYAPILGIGGIVKVLQTNTSMTWIIAIAVGTIFCLVAVLMAVAMPKFKKMQILVDRLNLISREILTGIPVIRAFSREGHEEKRFDGASRDLMQTQLFTSRSMAFMMPTMMFIMNAITVLIIWVGAHGIDTGNLQVGDMMAFITYTMQIVMSFLMITMVSVMLPRAAVAANRIDEILVCETSVKNANNPVKLKTMAHGVRFEHVNFRYNKAKEDVLKDINFTAIKGETTAIIGSTGCGKSTLVNLIPRLYDVTEGKVTMDGVDVRDIDLYDLRERIGFVPQKGVLFSGTIASNINFGVDKPTDENMKDAAKIAQAGEFINSKQDGFNESIAQGGGNVSGGQKQRLAIARAIAKNPELYVFDDSFSALDYKTDIALRKALNQKVGGAAVIIVAQRISTIIHADKIIVLEDGKIVGIGTHKELLETNEVYQQIAASQLSKEELEGKASGKEE
ncbi:MAG: ABC transporter ATP-binding protein [Velocimicrobium sp.]